MSYTDIEQITSDDYPEIIEVWEASVRATHHFLKEEDILFYKLSVEKDYLPKACLFCIRNEQGRIIGFTGIDGTNIDTLFIHPAERGKGLGKRLIQFAVVQHQADSVDVNEQNEQAFLFYQKMGFQITGRDAFDGTGKPYPILHLKLTKQSDNGVDQRATS